MKYTLYIVFCFFVLNFFIPDKHKKSWVNEIDNIVSSYNNSEPKLKRSKVLNENGFTRSIEVFQASETNVYKIKITDIVPGTEIFYKGEYFFKKENLLLFHSIGVGPILYKGEQRGSKQPCCSIGEKKDYFNKSDSIIVSFSRVLEMNNYKNLKFKKEKLSKLNFEKNLNVRFEQQYKWNIEYIKGLKNDF